MRSKKSKKIRKEVYGDIDFRLKGSFNGENGQIVSDLLRKDYQKAKGR